MSGFVCATSPLGYGSKLNHRAPVLVRVSICQGNPFWVPSFDPQPREQSKLIRLGCHAARHEVLLGPEGLRPSPWPLTAFVFNRRVVLLVVVGSVLAVVGRHVSLWWLQPLLTALLRRDIPSLLSCANPSLR